MWQISWKIILQLVFTGNPATKIIVLADGGRVSESLTEKI